MSNSPRRTAARPADRLGTARADLRKRDTTTWPDDTTEVVDKTALEPHERALLDDPGLHGALSEGLANLHLATRLDEDLLDPSQYTPAEAFPPGEYLRDELDERGWTVAQFAEMIDQPVEVVSEILDAKTGITPETAVSISEALGTSAELWLNLETTYRRYQRRLAADLGAHDH